MKKLMMVALCALAASVARAEEISGVMIDGLTYDLDTETKTAKITGYASSPQVVDVSTVKYENATYAVTAVADGVFWGCTTLTSVSLPLATQIGLSPDGTKLILPIPVTAQQGFMILQSGEGKTAPSDGSLAPITIKPGATVEIK